MARLIVAITLFGSFVLPLGVFADGSATLHVAVVGETDLKTAFISSIREAARAESMEVAVVPRNDADLDYTLIVAQESSIGGAAAAVIALDKAGDVAASVVRSGRLSGRGAINACAKEMIKKLDIIRK